MLKQLLTSRLRAPEAMEPAVCGIFCLFFVDEACSSQEEKKCKGYDSYTKLK